MPHRGNPTLTGLVRNWPTPVVTDAASSGRATTTTGVMHPGTSLTDAMRFHRDPETGQDGNDGEPKAVLNPEFVETLMGHAEAWTMIDDDTASRVLETQWCRDRLAGRSPDWQQDSTPPSDDED